MDPAGLWSRPPIGRCDAGRARSVFARLPLLTQLRESRACRIRSGHIPAGSSLASSAKTCGKTTIAEAALSAL